MSTMLHTAADLPPLPLLSAPRPGRNYRILIGTAILTGLILVLFLTLNGELFRPAREAFAAGDLGGALLRPSLLWATMGLLMLTVRPLLWFGYRPAKPADHENAPISLVRVLIAIGIGSSFYMLYYLYSERSMRFVHGILYAYFAFFTLWWIFPCAILTVRARSWLTR